MLLQLLSSYSLLLGQPYEISLAPWETEICSERFFLTKIIPMGVFKQPAVGNNKLFIFTDESFAFPDSGNLQRLTSYKKFRKWNHT